MEVLVWAVFGAIAGYVASLIMSANRKQGIFGDITLGILGALSGGLIVSSYGDPGVTGFAMYSILVTTLSAIVLIVIGRALARTT